MAWPSSLSDAVGYGAVCASALAIGGTIAVFRPTSAALRSHLQHIAAGLVFAAVAVEVLPDIVHRQLPLPAAVGFAAGVALMLAIQAVSARVERARRGSARWRLLGVVGVDIALDGLLIGVSAVEGQGQQALLVTVALAVELLSIGLAVGATLGQEGTSRGANLRTVGLLAVAPLVGAIGGHQLGAGLSAAWNEVILAFAAAALLYLATEELLREAHEVPETMLSTALFFAAFLALLLVDMVTSMASG